MMNKIEKLNSFKNLESVIVCGTCFYDEKGNYIKIEDESKFKFMFDLKSKNVYLNKYSEIDYKYLKNVIEFKYKRKIYFFLQIKPENYCNEIYFVNKNKTRLFKVSNYFQKYNLVNFEKAKYKWKVGSCLIKNLNFIKLDYTRRVFEKNRISTSQEKSLFNKKEFIPLIDIKTIPELKIKNFLNTINLKEKK